MPEGTLQIRRSCRKVPKEKARCYPLTSIIPGQDWTNFRLRFGPQVKDGKSAQTPKGITLDHTNDPVQARMRQTEAMQQTTLHAERVVFRVILLNMAL